MSLPSTDVFQRLGLRFVEVLTDAMEPTICRRGFVLLAPVDRYIGEGLYFVSEMEGHTGVYRCCGSGTMAEPLIRMSSDNPLYASCGPRKIPKAEFERIVTGKVAVTCKVLDSDLIHRPTIAA